MTTCGSGSLVRRGICKIKEAMGIKDSAQFKKDHAKFHELKEQRAKGVNLQGADKVCTIPLLDPTYSPSFG
jgi:hypothetical protein